MLSGFALINHDIFHDVFTFLFERSVVAVGHSIHVKAESLATAADHVQSVVINSGRREQAQALPIVYFS